MLNALTGSNRATLYRSASDLVRRPERVIPGYFEKISKLLKAVIQTQVVLTNITKESVVVNYRSIQ